MTISKPQYLALGFVTFVTLVGLRLPSRMSEPLESSASFLMMPLFAVAGIADASKLAIDDTFIHKQQLLDEVRRLRSENQHLRALTNIWGAHQIEAQGFEEAQEWRSSQTNALIFASIVARDPANWWNSIWVNRGSTHGVVTNQAVISESGAVGKVINVRRKSAQIVVLGDPSFNVAAKVRRTHEKGLIIPNTTGWLDFGFAELTFLEPGALIQIGDEVVSAREGSVFPPNILIGKIVSTNIVGRGLYQSSKVSLTANLSKLDHVWIIQ